MFTKNEIEKIIEHASESIACLWDVYNAIEHDSAMSKSDKVEMRSILHQEAKIAGDVCRKAKSMLERIEFALLNARPAMIAVATVTIERRS